MGKFIKKTYKSMILKFSFQSAQNINLCFCMWIFEQLFRKKFAVIVDGLNHYILVECLNMNVEWGQFI